MNSVDDDVIPEVDIVDARPEPRAVLTGAQLLARVEEFLAR